MVKKAIDPRTNRRMLGQPRKFYDPDAYEKARKEPIEDSRGRHLHYVYQQLTPFQKKFCQEYVKDFDPKSAYFRAGGKGKNHSTMINKLFAREKVRREIDRLKEQATKYWDLEPATIVKKVMDVYDGAAACGQWGSAAKAAELLGKYVGMFPGDRQQQTLVQVGITTGKNDIESIESDIKSLTELVKLVGLDSKMEDPNELRLKPLN